MRGWGREVVGGGGTDEECSESNRSTGPRVALNRHTRRRGESQVSVLHEQQQQARKKVHKTQLERQAAGDELQVRRAGPHSGSDTQRRGQRGEVLLCLTGSQGRGEVQT